MPGTGAWMAGVSVPFMTMGSVALRLGLGSGSGVSSSTTCGAKSAGWGAASGVGGAGASEVCGESSEISCAATSGGGAPVLGLRSGSGTIETLAAGSEVAVTIGTPAVASAAATASGLRSGDVSDLIGASVAFGLRTGGVSTWAAAKVSSTVGFRGVSTLPVVVASPGVDVVSGEVAGVTRSGLRSGSDGTTAWTFAAAVRAALPVDFFATPTLGAKHANSTSNDRACALKRFISSIGTGYDPVDVGQDVPRAGEPRR